MDKFMRAAIIEAQKSQPVPSAYCVGAVLVHNDVVVATGYSRELPGNTHAEECCFLKIEEQKLSFDARSCDLYTTMEPCSVRLSGNVSCTQHILRTNIVRRVVIGAREPDNFVVCEGVRQLQAANIEVIMNDQFIDECLAPNAHILQVSL